MRVIVSGVGIVSPLGRGARNNLTAMLAGHSAITPLRLAELPGARVVTAGQVADVEPPAPDWSRADTMAAEAAREALAEAGLSGAGVTLLVGGTSAGMFEAEETIAKLTIDPTRDDYDHGSIPGHVLTAPADRIHESLGPFAATKTLCSACSAGALAIAVGAALVRAGRAERVLAGGVDALCRLNLAGFAALGALDPAPCRPFSRDRAGLSLSEGAAFVVMESEQSARRRGARALVELAGWSMAAEAHHITQPAPDGAVMRATMRNALERAELAPSEVGYLCAHGTATPHNDGVEAQAIAAVFGAHTPVSSIKGHIGHGLAAAGAIEAAITILAVAEGAMPPTVGLDDVDPACAGIEHLRVARRAPLRAAVSSSFGFGGTDVVLAFRHLDGGASAVPASESAPEPLVITATSTLGHLGLDVDPLAYLEAGGGPADLPLELPRGELDLMRARRFDRASRLATIVAQRVLRQRSPQAQQGLEDAGVVVGSAFGSGVAAGRLLVRMFERGPRLVSPALFPTVLPSALAANPSIYLGLRGPALSCADLGASAEAALHLATVLLADRQASAIVAIGVEEHDPLASHVSSVQLSRLDACGRRGEGASALLVERASTASSPPLAVLRHTSAFRGATPAVPPPRGSRPLVIFARRGLEAPPSWERATGGRVRRAGEHESVGGFALVAAVAAIVQGVADEVLILGAAPDRGYAFILQAPGGAGGS